MSNRASAILNSCLLFLHGRLSQPCLLCGATARGEQLCPGCREDLPRLPEERCPRCALPSPLGAVCGACLRRPPNFDRTEALYAYAFPLDALVKHCKYQGALEVTACFARGLAEHLMERDRADVIIPMPLHPARLAERGFNQAAEVARRLSRLTETPWLPHACRRVRDTPPQAGLDLKARRRNLRGAFHCDRDLKGMRVALVDDVMTSGASLNELAGTVKQAGAASVTAWVVARTL